MKRKLTALALLGLFGMVAFAGSDPATNDDRNEIRFVHNNKRLPNEAFQYQLRHSSVWQQFLANHGTWFVEFNENNSLPHRAYGKPISVGGATPEEAALNFLSNELYGFNIPTEEIVVSGVNSTSKYHFVNFKQVHQGVDVLFSRTVVKLDMNNRVVMFGTDANSIDALNMTPTISGASAITGAEQGIIGTLETSTLHSDLFILPVPGNKEYVQHLVYEVMVEISDDNGIPGRYQTWVDAHDGTVLSRTNLVMHCGHSDHGDEECSAAPVTVDVNLTSDLFVFNPWIPETTEILPNANVTVNGTTYQTDANGNINVPLSGPVTGVFELAGTWSTVKTNNNTPSFTTTLQDGANAVTFDNDASVRERSAYFHVNIIHDYMKFRLPSFTGMDFSLETNVDVSGTCNAFYNGTSINFFEEGGDCQSYANIGDVVYHEYGHGINDNFYQDNGGNFQNGAMNEGYADVWGFAPFEDPILADGQSLTDPNDFIRRYDINPKVYPIDITGEVHNDGEIIAGAWWDTYVLMGNDMDTVMYLFAEVYPGLQAWTPNGNEGEAFRDVLLDVLQADDDDFDITNGTPNGDEIAEAFAIHGITLLSNIELTHDPITENVENDDILIEAEIDLQFPFTQYLGDVSLFYLINNDPNYIEVVMTIAGPDQYEATIPGQVKGTLISYYIGAYDIFNALSGVHPIGAEKEVDPNIPYYILVDMQLELTEDADDINELGNWQIGQSGDNATTGQWELNIPVGSFTNPGPPIDFNTVVAPYVQHTPGGELCFITGASISQQTQQGDNDVDEGTTTLLSGLMDLSTYTNPVLTYYRWYTNNTGSTPGIDLWQASLSDDGGSTWTPIEQTRVSDRTWRRFAIRVQDHVSITNEVMLKFNASDSAIHGGSIVEAALDDIQIWENSSSIGIEEVSTQVSLEVFPNPAQDDLTISFDLTTGADVNIIVRNNVGQVVYSKGQGKLTEGRHLIELDTRRFAEGLYTLDIQIDRASARKKLTIIR